MYVHSTDTKIFNKYHFPAAPQARLQGFMNTTHFIYIYSKIPPPQKNLLSLP